MIATRHKIKCKHAAESFELPSAPQRFRHAALSVGQFTPRVTISCHCRLYLLGCTEPEDGQRLLRFHKQALNNVIYLFIL